MKAIEELVSPPKTMMEVYKMLPEGTRVELINKKLYMPPSPNLDHQETAGHLFKRLANLQDTKSTGKIFFAPIDVYLDEHSNAVQPDLVFVSHENSNILKKDGIHGVPDLIIEILSPGNKKYDKVKKKNQYEKFGVKEYWIVDPESKEAVGYALSERMFEEFFRGVGKIQSRLLNYTFDF